MGFKERSGITAIRQHLLIFIEKCEISIIFLTVNLWKMSIMYASFLTFRMYLALDTGWIVSAIVRNVRHG